MMTQNISGKLLTSTAIVFLAGALLLTPSLTDSTAHARTSDRPALVITNDPLPRNLQNKVYSSPARAPNISANQISGAAYYNDGTNTVVGRKIGDLRNELFSLQGHVATLSEKLAQLQGSGRQQAAEYYASVATISTQLQTGTTPGNPRLIQRLTTARDNLERLSSNIAGLNDLAMEVANAASMSSFLLESARAAYSLSGAVEEDHVRLAQMEDAVNNTVVVIDRLLNNVNDDITRTVAYLGTERENLRTLSLAITTGDLFGKSLSNRPFSSAQKASFSPDASSARYMPQSQYAHPVPAPKPSPMMAAPSHGGAMPLMPAPAPQTASVGSPRPLVKIRFDRSDVNYQQPVYMAVNEALSRYPNARFELVAVHPSAGNSATVAIESTKSRRNAERVLRSLTQMGLSLDRVDLSYTPSAQATTNEVHLYIR